MRSIEQLRDRVRKCRERRNSSVAFKPYWSTRLAEAEDDLHHAINVARESAAEGSLRRDVFSSRLRHELSAETHVVVGDHTPEPRVNISEGVVGYAPEYPTRAQGGYGASFND